MTMKVEIYSDSDGKRRELAEMQYEDNLHIVIDGVDYCIWADNDNKLIVSADIPNKRLDNLVMVEFEKFSEYGVKIGAVKK